MTLKTLKAINQSSSLNMPLNNYKLVTSVLTDMTYSKRKILFTTSLIWRVSVIKTVDIHSRFRISRKKDTRLLWRYLPENRCFTVGRYITQSSSAILNNLRRQAKVIFVWYPKERADLKMIHDVNNKLTDDDTCHTCLYIRNNFKVRSHVMNQLFFGL